MVENELISFDAQQGLVEFKGVKHRESDLADEIAGKLTSIFNEQHQEDKRLKNKSVEEFINIKRIIQNSSR